jgi:23S rRNA pseudouridine1911/1915/1917 synthase
MDESAAGQRLDVVLAEVAGISRAQARRWIEAQRVLVNGETCRVAQKVRATDTLDADPPEVVPSEVLPEDIPLDVLHEDEDLIVINKPAGMVMHPAPGHHTGTLVHALLHHCDDLAGIGGVERPGIVHRLDRGTSGVVVCAKNDAAHEFLAKQFHDHTIGRVYFALVRSCPGADRGRVDRAIGRHPRDRKKMSVRTRSGRAAITNWEIHERFPKSQSSWVEVRPETGRTHQIRVHLSSVGMPLLGDPVYGHRQGKSQGKGKMRLDRPGLHAAELGFDHPRTGERMCFRVPVPEDLQAVLDELRSEEGLNAGSQESDA